MSPVVRIIELDGGIGPASADYLEGALDGAQRDGVAVAVIELDTPGGLSSSMRSIISKMLNLDVPTAVWVAPSGARAASAGTFITYAGDLAYMADSTEIGAASPIDISGSDVQSTLRTKIYNDAVAYITEIAKQHGRNASWAEKAVRDAASIGATQAVRINVVDGIANSSRQLLRQMDGQTITLGDGSTRTLSTWDAAAAQPTVTVQRQSMNVLQSLLQVIADPDLAYLLILAGVFGIVVEVFVPGFGLPGVLGATALVLGFYALSVLPTNWAGVALIALAVVLFIVDLHTAGLGVGTIGGAISLVAGGLILFSGAGSQYQVSIGLLIASAAGFVAFFGFALGALMRTRGKPATTGGEALPGTLGETTTSLVPHGTIRAKGALWKARSTGDRIEAGQRVRVVDSRGLVLIVEPLDPRT